MNWGIVGLGKIAHTFVQDLLLVENANVWAAASRDENKAQQFAEKYNIPRHYGSYEALANDPDVDIIYIATPHVFHFENSQMCLEKNKHIVCEKPLGINAKEVKKIAAYAQTKKRFLLEAVWTRFLPSTHKVLELLDQNTIGNCTHFTADFGFLGNIDPNYRLYNRNLGGGALLDIGIYPVFFSLLFLGKPKTIKAVATLNKQNVDSSCGILLGYEKGVCANLYATFVNRTRNQAIIYGEKGSITLHKSMHHSQKITVTLHDGSEQNYDYPYLGNGYYHEIVEVEKCISEGKRESDLMTHQNSIDLIETLDKIREKIGVSYPSE